MITIVLPVYNEELILKNNTLRVANFCRENLREDWQIIISDNASTDKTEEIAKELAKGNKKIAYFKSEVQGKGWGVLEAWQEFESDIYLYMDIDLAVDLIYVRELIKDIRAGYDIVAGSRFVQGAVVKRTFFRRLVSSGLRLVLKVIFGLKVHDAPCGFKAVNSRVVREILPQIENRSWFFDTEMLILAERKNFKIKEIGICWQDKLTRIRESKVGILRVAWDYLKNIYWLYKRLL